MSELALRNAATRRENGMSIAAFNSETAGDRYSVSQIEAARAKEIPADVFSDMVTLLCERFDKSMSAPLIRYYYQLVNERAAPEELEAAFHDLMGSACAWHNTIPYLIEHVERQRDNGPDLIALGMSEMYRRVEAAHD